MGCASKVLAKAFFVYYGSEIDIVFDEID